MSGAGDCGLPRPPTPAAPAPNPTTHACDALGIAHSVAVAAGAHSLKTAGDAHSGAEAAEGELCEEGGGGCYQCEKECHGDGTRAGCKACLHNAIQLDGQCLGFVTIIQAIGSIFSCDGRLLALANCYVNVLLRRGLSTDLVIFFYFFLAGYSRPCSSPRAVFTASL